MPLPSVAAGGPGGLLYCEYADSSTGERHGLRFYVGPFDPTPTGPNNDYSYQPRTSFTPSEASILHTFAGLGAVWAPYFTPSWALSIVAVAYNQDGVLTILPVVPTASPIAGTAAATLPPGVSVRRKFTLRAPADEDRRLFLSQMPGTQVDIGSAVTPTVGGLDARDRALLGYLSGSDTAIRSSSGARIEPDGSVAVWWYDRRVAPILGGEGTRDQFIGPVPPDLPQDAWLWVDTSGLSGPPWPLKVWNVTAGAWQEVGAVGEAAGSAVDALGNVGVGCLTWPLGAAICNTVAGHLDFGTPDGAFSMQADALVWPGGHKIAIVPPPGPP